MIIKNKKGDEEYVNDYVVVVEKVGKIVRLLPFHPLFDKRRNIRRSIGSKKLNRLAKEWQSH